MVDCILNNALSCGGIASFLNMQQNMQGKMQILGLASGVMQILALGNAKIYQHVGILNAKF